VPNREHAHFILRNHEPIQGELSGLSIGYDQLAQLTFDSATDQGMRREAIHGRLDGCDGSHFRVRFFVTQKLERARDVVERPR
jgi:phosphoenolpyruvate synthase/pyruvate phosphate dikinase